MISTPKNIKIMVKPLSVNRMYSGRHFPTEELTAFKQELKYSLPRGVIIPEGKLTAIYELGFSNRGSDIDNCIKSLTDCLSNCYGFNDNRIYELHVYKRIVDKGEEFISFIIKPYEQ